ncbi:hypothetical protein AcdelDRAFT_4222 [Acidovorax delafieldii 2AN]|uniref:Uncharacterized protein n=1 Tax=Acidovorax delafieldii 2AN TaxID=573060 RepID=C5TBE2_ACIDE|nr:hypothetical protein AcdelDRAFT_4222 [Acidovorax delafieldii 2AN]
MKCIPLSRAAASLFSHSAVHCGKGDDATAAGRPLRGVCQPRARQFYPLRTLRSTTES